QAAEAPARQGGSARRLARRQPRDGMSSTAAADRPPPPRLNPFAFPSDTTFRFVLLVVAVLGTTLFVWNWIYFAVDDHGAREQRLSAACLQHSPPPSTNLDAFTNGSRAFNECV